MLASLSDYGLANAVENDVVGSTPFTRRDIRIATTIQGQDVAVLKSKTTKKPIKMLSINKVRDIASYMVKYYSRVSLYIDVIM